MCTIHAHLLLMLRNATAAELTDARVTTIVCATVFLNVRHEWNMGLLDKPAPANAVVRRLARP